MEDWLKYAQQLKPGHKRKIKHCGASPSLSISADIKGWRGYCHRCGEKFWKTRETLLNVAQLAEFKASRVASITPMVPADASSVFEEQEATSLLWMTWNLKGGITQTLRDVYSLTWSKSMGRALLPVRASSGKLETLVSRRLHKDDPRPKYLMQSLYPQQAVYCSIYERATLAESDRLYDLVIVEDALSCIRVGEYVPTVSLLGTALGQGKLEKALAHSRKSSPRVLVWLDPDRAGENGTKKLLSLLNLMGLRVQWMTSKDFTVDPKNLTNNDIVRRLTVDRSAPTASYEDPARVRAT